MKKINLLLPLILIFSGCRSSKNDYSSFRFVVPTGAPSIAMSYFSSLENFETVTDPSTILPMMASGQVDVAVLPTNVGVSAIHQKKLPFQILGTITFGNFYIAATGNDENGIMEDGDYIVSFQKGAVPDTVFHYIHNESLDNSIHYVSSAQEAAKCLKLGKNLSDDNNTVDYVLIAEPALTTVMSSTPNVFIYENLQEKYIEKSNGIAIYQASVFVKNSIDKVLLRKNLEASITEMKSNPNKVIDYMSQVINPETIFGIKPTVAKDLLASGNKMGIGFDDGETMKTGVNLFLTLFNLEGITDEDIAK